MARDYEMRKDAVRNANAVQHRFPLPVPDRRIDGNYAGGCPMGLATQRFLFPDRSFPLCPRRCHRLYDLRGHLLLVSQGHWPAPEREPGQMALLALPDRFPHDLRYDALSRHPGNATSNLYL